jgi:protein TonB
MSSISVSAENLEALLQSAQKKPNAAVAGKTEHAASVSAEALLALLPPDVRENAVRENAAKENAARENEARATETRAAETRAAETRGNLEAALPRVEQPIAAAPPAAGEAGAAVEKTLPLLAARDRERVEQARFTPGRITERPLETPRTLPQASPPLGPQSSRPTPVRQATPLSQVAPAAPAQATPQSPKPERTPTANVAAPVPESEPSSANRTRMLMAVGAVVILVLGSVAYMMRGRKTAAPQVVAQPASLAMQLGAETMGSGLINVRWNPESATVAKAQYARLVIKEGDQQPRTVALSQAELKTGHLLYQSPADRLEFRLEGVDSSGASSGETIVVDVPKTVQSAAPGTPGTSPPVQNIAAQPTRPAGAAAPPPAAPVEASTQAANVPATPSTPKPQPKTFTLPAQRRPEPARGNVLLDAPGAVPAPTGVGLPSAGLTAGAFPAPPPPPAPAAPQLRTGGDLQPAALIRKVAPVYPALAKAARIQGAVRFSATVGKDGHLQNIQVLGGHSALVQAATDAVKQWVYRPTMLNGEPVEVVTQLEVNFTLNESGR